MSLTQKDLLFISDELSWELLAMKKCNHYAQECEDQEVSNLINKVGEMHKKHYEVLLNQLQNGKSSNTH